jgi:hypothetical protein
MSWVVKKNCAATTAAIPQSLSALSRLIDFPEIIGSKRKMLGWP